MAPHLLSKFKTPMINLKEQNNNDPLNLLGGGNDPLNLRGGGNDPLNLRGGGNDPLNLVPTPTPTPTAGQPTPTPTPTAGGGFTDTTLTGDDLKAGKVVKHGMKGDIVGKIQQLLIDKGFKNISKDKTPDSIFGNRTRRMVKAFQALNNLVDDGVVGKLTWNKLNDASAISAGDSTSANPNKPMEIPGADGVVYESLRKKILRKHLLSFK